MRPIDADDLQKAMEFVTNDPACPMHIAATIAQIIDCAPIVDLSAVRGEWSEKQVAYKDTFGNLHAGYQCSVCHAIVAKTPFCGACGAKMEHWVGGSIGKEKTNE
jgi:hypothetical protein